MEMSDETLTPAQRDDLRALAGVIIPASDEYRVPGADDDRIQADMLATLGRDARDVREALTMLAKLAEGVRRARSHATDAHGAAAARDGAPRVSTLTRVVLQCYYRDDRVVRSLGLEPRPPYPKGHVLEQGDWSLLDPVRERAIGWRKTT